MEISEYFSIVEIILSLVVGYVLARLVDKGAKKIKYRVMFSKSELIRFYREVDLNEPFVIYAYTEDLFKEDLKLEVSEDNLKLKFLPFIFTNFRELQCLSYVESYKDKGNIEIF